MILNPNLEERKRIGSEIKENQGYCPCMIIKNNNTKCPCLDKRERDICICGLYIKEE